MSRFFVLQSSGLPISLNEDVSFFNRRTVRYSSRAKIGIFKKKKVLTLFFLPFNFFAYFCFFYARKKKDSRVTDPFDTTSRDRISTSNRAPYAVFPLGPCWRVPGTSLSSFAFNSGASRHFFGSTLTSAWSAWNVDAQWFIAFMSRLGKFCSSHLPHLSQLYPCPCMSSLFLHQPNLPHSPFPYCWAVAPAWLITGLW